MSRFAQLLLLTILLLASSATAQEGPWIVLYHDWTVCIGDVRYGLDEWSVTGAETPYTGICFGKGSLTVNMRASCLLAMVLTPLGAAAAFLLIPRRARSEDHLFRSG